MNIKDKLNFDLPVSETSLFKGVVGTTSAFQIMEGIQLNSQTLNVPAMLLCIEGKVIFQDEKGNNETLNPGDYVNIKPVENYRIRGLSNSQLIRIE